MPAQSPLLLNRRRVLAGLGAVLVGVVVWYAAAFPCGMLMAYIDHAQGLYEVKTWGCPSLWFKDYRTLLNERYSVSLDAVADWEISPDVESNASGYNAVSQPLLVKKFGKDIFAECGTLAKQQWQARQHDEGDELLQ